jgi:hypothetical protein
MKSPASISSTSASISVREYQPPTGYVLVPVNSMTQAFLSVFAPSSFPNLVTTKNKNKNKKRIKSGDSCVERMKLKKKSKLVPSGPGSAGLAKKKGVVLDGSHGDHSVSFGGGHHGVDNFGSACDVGERMKLKKKSNKLVPSGPGSAGLAKKKGVVLDGSHGDHSVSFGGGHHGVDNFGSACDVGERMKLKKKSKLVPSGPVSAGLAKKRQRGFFGVGHSRLFTFPEAFVDDITSEDEVDDNEDDEVDHDNEDDGEEEEEDDNEDDEEEEEDEEEEDDEEEEHNEDEEEEEEHNEDDEEEQDEEEEEEAEEQHAAGEQEDDNECGFEYDEDDKVDEEDDKGNENDGDEDNLRSFINLSNDQEVDVGYDEEDGGVDEEAEHGDESDNPVVDGDEDENGSKDCFDVVDDNIDGDEDVEPINDGNSLSASSRASSLSFVSQEERAIAPKRGISTTQSADLPQVAPLVRTWPAPKFPTLELPPYTYNAQNAPAPKRDSVITFETMDTNGEMCLSPEPFVSKGIVSLQSYVKHGRGILFQNHSSCKLHYETDTETWRSTIIPKAKALQIPHHTFHPDGGKLHKLIRGNNVFIIISGGTFENFHDRVCFRDLIRDSCLPANNTIPKPDAGIRGNSGPSVGLASSQGTTKTTHDAYATPPFLKGTHRYSKVFRFVSETTRSLLASCRLSHILPPVGRFANPKQLSYQKRCDELCIGNLYLAMSFKIYVHLPEDVANHKRHFKSHRDVHNPDPCSPNDIFFTAWDTWFEPLLNLNVTGTIIVCGRRSQEELYDRMCKIGLATEEILTRSRNLPILQRIIHSDVLCPPSQEFIVRGCHLLQLHALTPNDYIYRLSKLLGNYHGLSAFLATEVIVAFHQTSNNSLRFHRFMEILLSSVEKTRDLRFLGQWNLVEAYQQYCFQTYGSWDGSTDCNGNEDGVVRHQACASCPISHYANLCSLQTLVEHLETAGLGPCNKARYGALVTNLKNFVIGFGDLKAQKVVMTFASLGLFLDKNFMSFFNTGSTQQLKNLKEKPFEFSRQEEVTQLRRTLLIQQPQLLPMQADEYICCLSSASKNKKGPSVGEVYYRNHSIFNASRRQDGSVAVHRLSWERKVNEPAPKIKFNYDRYHNHYVPTWAGCGTEDPPGNALVSLCSSKNLCHHNTRRSKSTFRLDFISSRRITPKDFQPLLFEGNYIVVPDLMVEACEYLGCTATSLSRATRIRRAAHGAGFTADIDMNGICHSDTLSIFGPARPTAIQAQRSLMLHVLIKVVVHGKGAWSDKFFNSIKSTKGFLLLVPTSSCESLCVAIAFVYIEELVIKCYTLDEKGNSGNLFTSDTVN